MRTKTKSTKSKKQNDEAPAPAAAQTNREKFTEEFSLSIRSGIGVLMVRSREPYRATEAILDLAITLDRTFRTWNCAKGWMEFNGDEGEMKAKDGEKQLLPALAKIDGWPPGINVMLDVYHALKPSSLNPVLMRVLAENARAFSKNKQRLVLLVPESFAMPGELENDIPVLDFDLPAADELRESLKQILAAGFPEQHEEMFTPAEVEMITASAAAMTEMEATAAYAKAIGTHGKKFKEDGELPAASFNDVVLRAKTDVVKLSKCLTLMPPVPRAEYGGNDLLIAYISELAAAFTPEALEFGGPLILPSGVVLCGPPGTGKTLVSKVIAHELRVPFVLFEISKIFGKYVGDTEHAMASALKSVTALGRAVVLLDEGDRQGVGTGQEASGSHETTARATSALLTHIQERRNDGTLWVITGNYPWLLDPALMQRMDDTFAILPPSQIERKQIIDIHLVKRRQNPASIKGLASVAEFSSGYASRELEKAVSKEVRRAIYLKRKVSADGIMEQLRLMKPLAEQYPEEMKRMCEWASDNARPSSSESLKELAKLQMTLARKSGARIID